ncbi:MAG TPA: glycine--tRNA ligase subunit beta [Sphingomicrobium sp.]|nr:glycine--tRNA ligase subunit beta [Sphingomicrobium sp.]
MADFLFEILSEEIPARMQARARNDLARLFAECVSAAGLETGALEAFSTPRRLVLIARDVAEATEASREELKGPRANAPAQALEGFLRKTGLSQDQLEERDGVLFAVIEREGRTAADVLAETIQRIVADFPWPKSMRWGEGTQRWVRPLHGMVAILGEDIVPVEVDGIASGATTVGHRFHHPGPITVGGACDYIEKLRACRVIVDQDERETLIREGAAKAAADAGLTLLPDEGLVVENAGLTEWPVPLVSRFDDDFLDVPREVIVLTMRTNQKYFACTGADGGLAPAFVCVANIAANDGGEAIAQGNARVLAARLADARFFWEQDVKVPLEEQAAKLSGIVFHEKLGTVADKVERVAKLARWLVEEGIVKADADQAERAARLAKADLVTGMVGEFPELQGVIGGYLAEAQGEPKAIADAIRYHYKPAGQGDEVPTAPVTVAVSLADKLDTIASFAAIDEKPTGSKDPFALRRGALGIIAIVLANEIRLPLWECALQATSEAVFQQKILPIERLLEMPDALEASSTSKWSEILEAFDARATGETYDDAMALAARANSCADYLVDFFTDRLKVQQREAGVRRDLIDAVHGVGDEDQLLRLLARVKALQAFVETDEGRDLTTAYKRAANILKKEGWVGPQVMSSADEQGIPQTGEEDPFVLVDDPILKDAIAEMAMGEAGADLPQEKALIAALDQAESKASAAIFDEDFTGAMAALATLRTPIDEFFDHVTVNDPNPAKREHRLNLLLRFRDAVNQVADFSKIEG